MNKDVADKATRKSRLPTNLPTENEVIRKTIKRRPARKQVEEGEVEKKAPEQSGQTYNHWYHKWAGGDKYDSYNAKTKSQTRCNIELDMGYTRADTAGNPYCCLFFARGCCPKGSDCSYLHRLPPSDLVLPDASLDVFGREKWSDYRDDMGGVGSFGRQNRTLYVGKIAVGNNMEGILLKHFDEWGDIERIKLLHSRGVGFVTYFSELSAQFAKESMMNQSLDNDEVLNVRWATEDPNPKAKVYEYERLVELGKKGIGSKLTPEFIDAVRRMDELEGLVKERGYDPDDVRAIEGSSSTNGKRPAIEDGAANGDGPSADGAQASKKSRTDNGSTIAQPAAAAVAAPVKAPSQAKGLLSGSALDSLKKAAALRKLKQQKAAEATAQAAK